MGVILQRLLSFLQTLSKSNPKAISVIVEKMRKGGASVGDSVESIVKYAQANKVHSAFTLTTLGSLGIDLAQFIGLDDAEDDDETEFLASLLATADKVRASGRENLLVSKAIEMIKEIGEEDEELSVFEDPSLAKIVAAKQVLQWAVANYGNPTQAIRAHQMAQAFHAMPLSEVQFGYENLNI